MFIAAFALINHLLHYTITITDYYYYYYHYYLITIMLLIIILMFLLLLLSFIIIIIINNRIRRVTCEGSRSQTPRRCKKNNRLVLSDQPLRFMYFCFKHNTFFYDRCLSICIFTYRHTHTHPYTYAFTYISILYTYIYKYILYNI